LTTTVVLLLVYCLSLVVVHEKGELKDGGASRASANHESKDGAMLWAQTPQQAVLQREDDMNGAGQMPARGAGSAAL
jgi:hypothetical protein